MKAHSDQNWNLQKLAFAADHIRDYKEIIRTEIGRRMTPSKHLATTNFIPISAAVSTNR
jgi:hypothetical protein